MSIAIGDAAHAGASTPVVPPASPSMPPINSLAYIFLGWLFIAMMIARRLRVFRRNTVLGPQRVGPQESAWQPMFLFFATFVVAGLIGPTLVSVWHVSGERRLYVQLHTNELLIILLTMIAMQLFRNNGLERLGCSVRQFRRGIIGGGIAIFTLFPVVTIVGELTSMALRLMGRPQPMPHQVLQALHSSGDRTLILIAVGAAVFTAPLYEELLFRGCAQTALSYGFEWIFMMLRLARHEPGVNVIDAATVTLQPQNSPATSVQVIPDADPQVHQPLRPRVLARWCAILVAAALFAAVHGVWAFVPPLFVLAVGLGFAYEMTGNLWVTIIAHALFNSVQILIFSAVQ